MTYFVDTGSLALPVARLSALAKRFLERINKDAPDARREMARLAKTAPHLLTDIGCPEPLPEPDSELPPVRGMIG